MSDTRTVHDPFLGKDVEVSDRLVDRLRGRYAQGPTLPSGEPEFGWREYQTPPIQHEAAAEIERLRAALADLEREWQRMDVKPDHPMMVDLFYRDLFFTDYKTGAKVSAVMDRGRDERFGVGWWDGETWKHSGTAHGLFENYSDHPKEQFPTHWRALSPTVPDRETQGLGEDPVK